MNPPHDQTFVERYFSEAEDEASRDTMKLENHHHQQNINRHHDIAAETLISDTGGTSGSKLGSFIERNDTKRTEQATSCQESVEHPAHFSSSTEDALSPQDIRARHSMPPQANAAASGLSDSSGLSNLRYANPDDWDTRRPSDCSLGSCVISELHNTTHQPPERRQQISLVDVTIEQEESVAQDSASRSDPVTNYHKNYG